MTRSLIFMDGALGVESRELWNTEAIRTGGRVSYELAITRTTAFPPAIGQEASGDVRFS